MGNNYLIYSLEDDKDISHIINVALSKQGYIVKSYFTPSEFFEEFNVNKPNMVLLDLMLPEMSGEEVLKKIRDDNANDDIQVIILSAKSLTINKIDGLDLGADDYIAKPFDVMELISRVNAHARRYLKGGKSTVGDFMIDYDKHEVFYKNQEIKFTNTEYKILTELIKNRGKIVTRDELFLKLWGDSAFESRTLDVHIKAIRKKINDNDQKVIETIYGVGYLLKE